MQMLIPTIISLITYEHSDEFIEFVELKLELLTSKLDVLG